MKKNTLNFYHIVKNEDAYTYSYEESDWGFIVAADGLGGSGSTVHRLDESLKKDLESRLKAAALPEYFNRLEESALPAEEEAPSDDIVVYEDDGPTETTSDEEPVEESGASDEGDETEEAENADASDTDGLSLHPGMDHDEFVDRVKDRVISMIQSGAVPSDVSEDASDLSSEEAFAPADETVDSDDLDPAFGPWVDSLLEPMLDGEDDTSALWGSRIAIMRFVHYMLTHADVSLQNKSSRREIVDYIYQGLEATRDAFGLEAGELSGQCVLPTTLVCMRYNKTDDGRVVVEAVWAGDSRGYALIPEVGMKQITVDDEDESGAIVNLFALRKNGERMDTRLNYVNYALPARSALFVCSDGVFDPYAPIDNIGVERTFLTALDEATSFDELQSCWKARYTPMRHDDTTVSFVAFDFDDFVEFKSSLIHRLSTVAQAMDNFVEGLSVYQILQDSYAAPDSYIRQRANSSACRPKISAILAGHMASAPAELSHVVTAELRDAVEREVKTSLSAPICERILSELIDHPDRAAHILRVSDVERDPLFVNVRQFLHAAEKEKQSRHRAAEYTRLEEEGNALIQQLLDRKAELEEAALQFEQMQKSIMEVKDSTVGILFEETDYSYKGMQHFLNTEQNFYRYRYDCTKSAIESIDSMVQRWTWFVDNRDGRGFEELCQAFVQKLKCVVSTGESSSDAKKTGGKVSSPYSAPKKENSNGSVKLYPMDIPAFERLKEIYRDLKKLSKEEPFRRETHAADDSILGTAAASMKNALKAMMKQPHRYFTDAAITAYGVDALLSACGNADTVQMTVEMLLTSDDALYEGVIEAFLTCKEPTIIDSAFNASRLADYREFIMADHHKVIADHDLAMEMVNLYENMEAYRY